MGNSSLSPEIIAVLSSLEFSGAAPRFIATITQGQLPTNVYAGFKKVLAAIGGKWESRKQVHSFPHDPRPLVEQILRQGYLPDLNPLDYYPTPKQTVDPIIDSVRDELEYIADLRADGGTERVLEPSAGSGAFSDAMAAIAGAGAVLSLELNPVNVAVLRSKGHLVEEVDFLSWTTNERFRLIVMNPPFDGRTWKKHLQHAYQFLAPGGRLVCIAPTSACEDVTFLTWALARGNVERNEEKAFKASGTDVGTVTIYLRWDPAANQRSPTDGYPSFEAMSFDVVVASGANYHDRCEAISRRYVEKSQNFELGADDPFTTFSRDLKALAEQVMKETLSLTALDDADCRFFANYALKNVEVVAA